MVLWESKHGTRSVGGRARTFVDLLEADTGVPRDCLPAAMDDRVGWRKKARGEGERGGGGRGRRGRGSTEVDLVVVVAGVVLVSCSSMCFVFLYLHLFSAAGHVPHGKAL